MKWFDGLLVLELQHVCVAVNHLLKWRPRVKNSGQKRCAGTFSMGFWCGGGGIDTWSWVVRLSATFLFTGAPGSAKLVGLWWKGAEFCLQASYFQMAVYGAISSGYLSADPLAVIIVFSLCLDPYRSKSARVLCSFFWSGIQRLGTDVTDFKIHHYNSSWCVLGLWC